MGGEERNCHIEEIIPALRIINASEFFVAFLKEEQTIGLINIWYENLNNIQVMEFRHSQVIGSSQHINDRRSVMNIIIQEVDIFSFEVFEDEEISILGNPVREREGKLNMAMNTSEVSFIVWLSVSEANSSLFNRNA